MVAHCGCSGSIVTRYDGCGMSSQRLGRPPALMQPRSASLALKSFLLVGVVGLLLAVAVIAAATGAILICWG
ncbi:hypothetical protein R75461_07854 [Paraburkholderia nemoris]|nr:hypothetical protein R75461_07854 [Paraburkholderia nemoris]